ncbi:hypothetical protein [Silvibacterium acidisoli]|uniref:hypothetical protein n=1 Tax=Acidobacteriaceae bacterium ZG23-2 TaxID=2883246 RepID=UPI00406D2C03
MKKRSIVAVLPSLLLLSLSARAQTTITVDPEHVIHAHTEKPGANMGTPTSYDSGMIYKNLLLPGNVGGEGALLQQMWQVQEGGHPLSATKFNTNINNTQYDQVPADWWKGAKLHVVQSCGPDSPDCSKGGPELDCKATITGNTKTGTSPNGATYSFAPACAAPIAVGDLVVLTQKFSPLNEAQLTSGNWGVTAAAADGGHISEESDDVCGGCGASSYKLDVSHGGTATLRFLMDNMEVGGTFVNRFRRLNGNYILKFAAKQVSGSTLLSFEANRQGGFHCGPYRANLTSEWAMYSVPCKIEEGAMTQNNSQIQVQWTAQQGGMVYLDNLDFEKAPETTDSSNTTIFSDAYVHALKKTFASGSPGNPGTLRYNPSPDSETLDSWILPANARPMTANGVSQTFYTSGTGDTSLQDFLHLCETLKVDPLVIVPITFTAADAKGLIDFLYGDKNTAYGAKRIDLGGPAAPGGYASVFHTIHLAFGNENWNGGFVGQAIGFRFAKEGKGSAYQDYTSRFNTIATAMRGVPSYRRKQTELIMGVQTAMSGAYIEDVARDGHPDAIELEQYTQGEVNDDATPELLYRPAFAEAYVNMHQADSAHGVYQTWKAIEAQKTCGADHATQCKANVYEENNGTEGGKASQSSMNGFAGGGAYGVITFNQFLQSMEVGDIMTQDLYELTAYYQFGASKYYKIFGSAIDYGGACSYENRAIFGGDYCPRPTMLAIELASNLVVGKMIGCSISGTVGAAPYDLPANHNGINPQKGVPTIYSYCFQSDKDPNSYAIAVVNESLTKSYPVSWAGAGAPGKSVKRIRLAPANPYDTNEAPQNWVTNTTQAKVSLKTDEGLDVSSGDTVPPDSVSVYLYSASGRSH